LKGLNHSSLVSNLTKEWRMGNEETDEIELHGTLSVIQQAQQCRAIALPWMGHPNPSVVADALKRSAKQHGNWHDAIDK